MNGNARPCDGQIIEPRPAARAQAPVRAAVCRGSGSVHLSGEGRMRQWSRRCDAIYPAHFVARRIWHGDAWRLSRVDRPRHFSCGVRRTEAADAVQRARLASATSTSSGRREAALLTMSRTTARQRRRRAARSCTNPGELCTSACRWRHSMPARSASGAGFSAWCGCPGGRLLLLALLGAAQPHAGTESAMLDHRHLRDIVKRRRAVRRAVSITSNCDSRSRLLAARFPAH